MSSTTRAFQRGKSRLPQMDDKGKTLLEKQTWSQLTNQKNATWLTTRTQNFRAETRVVKRVQPQHDNGTSISKSSYNLRTCKICH
eukprot:3671668-Amphidinium_carterae.1